MFFYPTSFSAINLFVTLHIDTSDGVYGYNMYSLDVKRS